MLANLCYVSRGMGVRKVSNSISDLQGRSTSWRQLKSDCHQTLSVITLVTGDEGLNFKRSRSKVKVGGKVCALLSFSSFFQKYRDHMTVNIRRAVKTRRNRRRRFRFRCLHMANSTKHTRRLWLCSLALLCEKARCHPENRKYMT